MTRREKIAWLSQYVEARNQYNTAFESYVSYRMKVLSIKAQVMSGMPICSNPSSDKILNSIIELETIERKMLIILDQLQALREKIKTEIKEVRNNNSRDILTQRYIYGYRWQVIFQKSRYSPAQIFRLHILGLDEIKG